MRAIVMTSAGGPEVLVPQDVPPPSPASGQVLVRTELAGVSFVETQLRSGAFPVPAVPAVFGFEAAGIVEAGQADLVGRRVVAMSEPLGAYAEFLAVDAAAVYPIPDGLSSAAALAVSMHAAVALALLDTAALDGETVLIEAAGTGIGAYLTQLARSKGAGRIVATAGTEAKRKQALSFGADEVLDHSRPDWAAHVPAGIDVVFESIGGPTAAAVLDAMTPLRGRMLCYGLLSGRPPQVGAPDLVSRGLSIVGCGGPAWLAGVAARRGEAHELAAAGVLTPLIHDVLPLEQAAEAHRLIEAHEATGKVLLRV